MAILYKARIGFKSFRLAGKAAGAFTPHTGPD